MANAWYDSGINGFATKQFDWTSGSETYKVILVDLADYTFSASHQYLTSVGSDARVATATITGRTASAGVLDASDTTFTSVSGHESEALIIYKDTGTEATSPLLLYLDTGITGIPVTPVGLDVFIQWDNGTNKIARL